jgi:hypothetical protein
MCLVLKQENKEADMAQLFESTRQIVGKSVALV